MKLSFNILKKFLFIIIFIKIYFYLQNFYFIYKIFILNMKLPILFKFYYKIFKISYNFF